MFKIYTAAALISLATFVSCAGSNDKEYVDQSIVPAGTDSLNVQSTEPAASIIGDPNALPGNANVIPGTASPAGLNQTLQNISVNPQNAVPQQAGQVAAAGMNPAHGQPGHRCDISVGAPLNSKPAPAAQPATVSTSTTAQPAVTMTEVPNTQKTAAGMNPAHGQPGHRCDIAVGESLNSKPAPSPTTVSTTPAPATTVSTPQPVAQKTAPGMNPAHGEPGHRCDIAVGESLNSKPAATKDAAPAKAAAPPPLLTPVKSGGK